MATALYVDMADTDTNLGVGILREAGFNVAHEPSRDPTAIIRAARHADALLVGYAAIDAQLLDALPQCKIVSLLAAGVDTVDVDAASARGVWVANVPGIATDDVATHALALTLSMLRQLPRYQANASADWMGRGPIAPPKLSRLTLGLIGLGQIGRRFGEFAAPLFGSVIGHDPLIESGHQNAPAGIEVLTMSETIKHADVLSVHVPLVESTANMVNEAFLAAMKPGSYFVNVSRGGLVESHALANALKSGHLEGAALDTIDLEPAPADHPLLNNPRVILTPHVAYFSSFTEVEYVRVQAQNVVSWLQTGQPDFAVPPPSKEERKSRQ